MYPTQDHLFYCSFYDSFLFKDTMARRPADPEEELRWMSQEVRGYVEAVLNSLAANVPKVYTHNFSRFSEPCDSWNNVH